CRARSSCRSRPWRSRRRDGSRASWRSAASSAARRRTSSTSRRKQRAASSLPRSRRASRLHSASSPWRTSSRRKRGSGRAPKRCARHWRWPTRSRSSARRPSAPDPRPLHWPADVQGLRRLREEAGLRPQPEPLDGGDEAPLRPEPPACPCDPPRQADARVRLHPLPQGRQGPEGRLATAAGGPWSNRDVEAARPLVSPLGRISISNDAVAHIVGRVVAEAYGVVGMASRAKSVGRLLTRDRWKQGITVGGSAEDGVTIELNVIVEYGLNLAEVASTVRNRVRYEVERLTGLPVASV